MAQTDGQLQQGRTIKSRLLRVVPSGQTASIKLTRAGTQDTPRSLIGRADCALYAGKDAGRDQVLRVFLGDDEAGVVRRGE